MAPTIAAAIIVGALCCAGLARYPKAGVALVLVMTMLSQTLQTMTGSSLVGYADELAVLLAAVVLPVRRLWVHGSLRFMTAYWCFAGFAAAGVVSALLNTVPLSLWAVSGFLFLKGPLLMMAVLQIDWGREDISRIVRWGTVAVMVLLFSALCNAVIPEAWNSVVGRQEVSYRLGVPSLTGLFDHPVGLASVMGMAFLAVLSYRRIVNRTLGSLLLLVATAGVGLATFRRKSLVSVFVVAIGGRLVLPGERTKFVTLLLLLLPLGLLVAWAPLTELVTGTYEEYFSNIDTTARTTMTIDAAGLALAAFPLGVGFGRFGSAVASANYSPLYEHLGYSRIHGMGPGERGGFLTDTFWPAVMAEAGILGLLCYLAGLFLMIRPAWALMRRSDHPGVQWAGAVAVAWIVQLLIESAAAPVFTGPPMFGPAFAMAGVAAALHATERRRPHVPGRFAETPGASSLPDRRGAGPTPGRARGRHRLEGVR